MTHSVRRPQRVYSAVMWILSFLFAACLIGLGSLVIRDLPKVEPQFTQEDYVDQAAMQPLIDEVQSKTLKLEELREKREDEQAEVAAAEADYMAARDNFEAWLVNRSVTEASDQNPEVAERTRNVEAMRDLIRAATADVEAVDKEITEVTRSLDRVIADQRRIRAEAYPAYSAELNKVKNRVFMYRLMLTLPLLIIAGFLLARYRQSNYWPLYRGFVLFSAFAFFVELVPYMPSYGGYLRYGAGIVAVLIAGHFIIRAMRRYLERQQKAEERSESERRKSIAYEVALKKLEANTCPGCDRSIVHKEGQASDYCVHCGMTLNADCGGCGTHKVAFYKFCMVCGHDCREDHQPLGPEMDEFAANPT